VPESGEDEEVARGELLFLLGLLGGFGDLAGLAIGFFNRLDDADGDGLTHVADGKAAQGRVLAERLDAHRLGRDHLDHGGVARLDKLGRDLDRLAGTAVNLLGQLRELARNVGGVAVEDGGVAGADLARVVEDNDLGVERSGLHGGVVLGVGADVSSSDVLDGHVLDVETDVVSWQTLGDLLVVHLDGFDFSGDVCWGENDNHTSLDDTGLDSADRHCADTANFIHVLKRKTEGLVGRTLRGVDGVDGIQKSLALGRTSFGLLGPTFVPGHVGGFLQHVVTVPARDRNERNRDGVVSDLLDEVLGLLDDFVESVLRPLAGVHLVASNDELPDTKGEGEEGVLSGLSILGDTSLELSDTGGNDQDGAVGLRGSGNHVLDEISVSWGAFLIIHMTIVPST